jgi:hypothetical protein
MLNQVQEGISTGFELVSFNGEKLYRVSVETYATSAKEASAIAQRFRRETELFQRPRVEADGSVTLELHCYCDDQTHTHFWKNENWECARCARSNN